MLICLSGVKMSLLSEKLAKLFEIASYRNEEQINL